MCGGVLFRNSSTEELAKINYRTVGMPLPLVAAFFVVRLDHLVSLSWPLKVALNFLGEACTAHLIT